MNLVENEFSVLHLEMLSPKSGLAVTCGGNIIVKSHAHGSLGLVREAEHIRHVIAVIGGQSEIVCPVRCAAVSEPLGVIGTVKVD